MCGVLISSMYWIDEMRHIKSQFFICVHTISLKKVINCIGSKLSQFVDFVVAIGFIILFILCMPYNTLDQTSETFSLEHNNDEEDVQDVVVHDVSHDHKNNKNKPFLRGILHIISSCILPIVYWFMGTENFSMEAMILCCTVSGMYHRLAPYIGDRYVPTFQLMDYLGSDVTILAYAMILFEKHGDVEWIQRMPIVTAALFVSEFILFYYHYHVKPLKELNRMLTHVLCLGFTMFPVIKYQDYASPWFLLMAGLYFISFYIFAIIDSSESEHWVWSQHETFHLILLLAFIVHLYISMR